MCVCMCVIIQLKIYCQLQRIKLQSVLVGNGTIARCGATAQVCSTVPDAMQLHHQGGKRILRKVLRGTPGAASARDTPAPGRPCPCSAPTLPQNNAV